METARFGEVWSEVETARFWEVRWEVVMARSGVTLHRIRARRRREGEDAMEESFWVFFVEAERNCEWRRRRRV